MIVYFTKQYQAVPALMQLYKGAGGIFVSTRGSTIRSVRRVYPDTRIAKLNQHLGRFSAGDRILRESGMIITGSPNRSLLEQYSAKKCMVFHGTFAYLVQSEVEAFRHFDLICVIGPRMQDVMEKFCDPSRLIASGYIPFMEFPVQTPEMRSEFLESLGLNPENKTLLYLPRGKPFGSWDIMAEKLTRQVPKHYNLIMRPHPSQSVVSRVQGKWQFMRLARIGRERGNTYLDLVSCRLSTLFSVADLVISDGASSPEEALYYDVPQVFIESQNSSRQAIAEMMRRKKIDESYIEKLLTIYQCGKIITPDSSNMPSILEQAIEENDFYRPYRNTYFNWVFGERGLDRQRNLINQLKRY